MAELLDPLATIERELREELIIIEPTAGHRYVFDWNEGRRADHPDFAIARRVWHEVFQKRNFRQLSDLALPLKWLPGHDSVVIRFNNLPSQPPTEVEVAHCLLNVNAEDFGIEIDRVAKIAIGPEAILCDGEVVRGKLLNRVIGLFEVHRFNAAMAAGRTEFRPDCIFHSGQDRSKDGVQTVVSEYLADVTTREVWETDVRPEWEATTCKYGLCPVTRNLIRRFLLLEQEGSNEARSTDAAPSLAGTPTLPGRQEVFLSFASEALPLAQQLFSFLQDSGRQVFFSDETLHQANFGDAVDNGLKAAKSLVVVGTETEHFFKPWVRYEWQSFHNDILARRKPWETPLVTLAVKPDRNALPRPLVFREVVPCDPESPVPSFRKVLSMLG
ncbi:MAG: toll/interleukin-1 receptor domain-containing protein [Tepidisphaeraceae bacterium]